MNEVAPASLKDAAALIQAVFPAQKISFEAQKERKANLGQTLTGLGSYWKGRKPLILVRAIVLGSLLPQTGDSEKDLEIFEKLMAFDGHGLARRAFVQNDLKPKHIASRISLSNPWDYFTFAGRDDLDPDDRLLNLECPFDADEVGISLRWDRGTSDEAKLQLIERALATFPTYEEKASFCKRPEEVDQAWLYAPVWPAVNNYYAKWGINARSFPELLEQIGRLRFGHRPRVGDTFCGGGSIPFEAARLGCDVYASDLNPVACMLTWGAMNIIGASDNRRATIERAQERAASNIDNEITELGIEHDSDGNRAKTYLYCTEITCPETGWSIPVSASWVLSKTRNAVAKLRPNHEERRFEIDVFNGVSKKDIEEASRGTLSEGHVVYERDGRSYRIPIRTLRGDYRNESGATQNRLRKWNKEDIAPKANDVFRERLYAIQWTTKDSLDKPRQETFFSAPTKNDREIEEKIFETVSKHLVEWQRIGLVPDMEIESGYNTDQPIRERGWSYWHHLFNPRQLLVHSIIGRYSETPESTLLSMKSLDYCSKLCRWDAGHKGSSPQAMGTFTNQALNTVYNYGVKSGRHLISLARVPTPHFTIHTNAKIDSLPASRVTTDSEIWITDPPYADAVNYCGFR